MGKFAVLFGLWFLLPLTPAWAQKLVFHNAFFGFVDNREYKSIDTEDKTIFGAMYLPRAQWSVGKEHHIYVGGDFRAHFGTKSNRFTPTLYYNFRDGHFDFALGFIPRHERLREMPRMVLADTLLYDRPNIEGMHLAFRRNGIRQSLHIDWLNKQTAEDRERFVVGLSGKIRLGRGFCLANDALLYHNALTSSGDPDERVQDNATVQLRLGWDASGRRSGLDSLTADAGYAIGFDRLRTVYERAARGFVANLYAERKRFFLTNALYLGDAQHLPMGDPFYRRQSYDRLDIGWIPFRKTFGEKGKIEGRLTFTLHFAPDATSNQQAFLLRIAI